MSIETTIEKNFGSFQLNVSFSGGNEVLAILGGSGCGKSMTLKCIAGIVTPDEGQIIVDGVTFFDSKRGINLRPQQRRTGLLFQNYALFPNMTTRQNIMTVFEHGAGRNANKEERYQEIARRFFISGLEDHYPSQLSGGQQQRVAIARALVNEPEVLLLDEPLGALDLKLRKEMQHELKKIQKEVGITFIFVTHDQEEALTMSDKIVVMKDGEIQQIGTPEEIYNEPENEYVARFIGESNIIDGVMLEDCKVEFCGRTFECVDKGFEKNAPVDVVIRPEDLKIVYAGDGLLQGVVESIVFKGVHYEMMVRTQFFTFMVHSTMAESVGKTVGLSVIPFDIHIMHKSAEAQA